MKKQAEFAKQYFTAIDDKISEIVSIFKDKYGTDYDSLYIETDGILINTSLYRYGCTEYFSQRITWEELFQPREYFIEKLAKMTADEKAIEDKKKLDEKNKIEEKEKSELKRLQEKYS